ncbi:MAG: hypothetical protein WC238_05050 [Parcubacteria group bacterium]|jgi:hypothetical protein
MKKGFLVEDGSAFSINDLVELKRQGRFVARTGHLGNHYLSNLLLFSCGIPCAIFDRNLLLKDQNFWPSKIIHGGKKSVLAREDNVLVPFGHFAEGLNGPAEFAANKKNPAQVHYESMQSVFGKDSVYTESQFLHQEAAMVSELVEVMCRIDPELFARAVAFDGKTRICFSQKNVAQGVLAASEAMSLLVEGRDADFLGGIIPRVEAAIMLNSILGQRKSLGDAVYELSGPDMVKYALRESFREKVKHIYSRMCAELNYLPETLVLKVVPSFSFRLGSLESEKEEMDHIFRSLKEFFALSSEKKVALKEANQPSLTKLSQVERNLQNRQISGVFNERLRSIAQQFFFSEIGKRIDFTLEGGNFFSQYDLIESGEKMYVPEEIKAMSMEEMNKFHCLLDVVRRYV